MKLIHPENLSRNTNEYQKVLGMQVLEAGGGCTTKVWNESCA